MKRFPFNTHSIRFRVVAAIVTSIGFITISIYLSLYQCARMSRSMQSIEYISNEIGMISNIQLAIEKSLMPPNDYLITGDITEQEHFNTHIKEIESLLLKFNNTFDTKGRGHILFDLIQKKYNDLKILANKIFTLPDPVGSTRGAGLMKRLDSTGMEFTLLLDQYHAIAEGKLEAVQKKIATTRKLAVRSLIGSGLGLTLLTVILGVRFYRSIIRPVSILEEGTEHVARGDWKYRVNIHGDEEFETLARHFNNMAERLEGLYHSFENQLAERTQHLTEKLEDLYTILETSTELSTSLDIEHLLSSLAERLTYTLKANYCRIALIDDNDHGRLIVRAAFPRHSIGILGWEPRVGEALGIDLPYIQNAFDNSSCIILSPEELNRLEHIDDRIPFLTRHTKSVLICPLILNKEPEGIIILGEAREWKKESFYREKMALYQIMANQVVVAIVNARNYYSLQDMFLSTVTTMTSAIDAKSPWTRGHSERVTYYAVVIGEHMGLDSTTLNHLRLGCLLHDIGKIGTTETLLDKPGPLTDKELAIVSQHSAKGEEILRPIKQFKSILPVVRHHHERYDGNGYPDGLKGDKIPLLARIAAVADTYDSMTADRPYRDTPGREKAIEEIKRCAGTQFDPFIAKLFVSLLKRGYI